MTMSAWARPSIPSIPKAPAEGWITVLLVLVLCLTMAWSIDDTAPVLGRDAWTDFLIWTAIGGAVAGFVGAKAGWNRWVSHLIGVTFGALLVPVLVGAVLVPDATWPDQQYIATAASVVGAWEDLVVRAATTTTEIGHHLLVFGLFVWATSMFASYAVFGHRRPLDAILVVGIVLIVSMSLTYLDQLFQLVVFSVASLLLLIRSHVLDEQGEWLRRRIGDPSTISSIYLKGGAAFVSAAVLGSLILTSVAASAPLRDTWRDVGSNLLEWSRGFQRFLPEDGRSRAFQVSFGSSSAISQRWTTNQQTFATIQLSPQDTEPYYWRVQTFDKLEWTGFDQTEGVETARQPGESILDGSAEAVDEAARPSVTVRGSPAYRTSAILAPMNPLAVDIPVRVELLGDAGYFTSMSRDGSADPYSVTSQVPRRGNEPGDLNENALRTAGLDYPDEIEALYLVMPEGAMDGPDLDTLRADLQLAIAQEASATPYDIAHVMELYLRANFAYDDDIRDEDCTSLSTAQCFARIKRGFCQYYAYMMAGLLRERGIPARIAEGFLPGSRVLTTGTETILDSNLHAWVEVYFPGHGWVMFDPTGGGLPQTVPLPSGPPIDPNASPSASVPQLTRPPEPSERVEEPTGNLGPLPPGSGSAGPLIAVAVLLALTLGGVAFALWLRGPRGPITPDGVYGSISRLAGRFGFGPRPTQTVYEYAGALGEVLPIAKPELETVAQAKVEVAYGRHVLGEERLAALRNAQRRLRLNLLRLAFRRDRRRR